MQKKIRALFSLVRFALYDDKLPCDELEYLKSDEIGEVVSLAKRHDIDHLVYYALQQNGLANADADAEKSVITAIYRYERMNREYLLLCKALEEAKIPFLPLKGSIIRKYYQKPWMRTSCDIDVLVHEDDLEKAISFLTDKLNYKYDYKSSHDVSLASPNQIHIELHYDLLEDWLVNSASDILKTVWDTAIKRNGYEYFYEMPDEMFYFYHVAHMAKHFERGGCGIRPFIDLWILNNIEDASKDERAELLNRGGLTKFFEVSCDLSKVWFTNCEHNDVTRRMEGFVLCGGVYGTTENRITIQQQKKGGKFSYLLSKIFLPYDVIKYHYPILEAHRWLMPLMQVRRWFKLAFCGHAKRVVREIKCNNNISQVRAEDARKLLEDIGL